MSKVRLFGHSLLWFFTVSLGVLAVLLMTARFFLTEVPEYKHDLEVYLSEEIGAEVGITSLSARMSGFNPQLSLRGITINGLNKQTNALKVGEIRLSFNPLDLVTGETKPNKITIVNSHIKIQRLVDGRFSLVGLTTAKNTDASSGDFSWLLEGRRYEVMDSQIIWQDDLRDLPDITLEKANIIFQNKGPEHALKVTAALPTEKGGTFVLAIKVRGDVLSTTNWDAKGYFKAEGIDIAEYLTRLKVETLSIDQGEGDVELWSTWKAAKLSKVKGNALVRRASLRQGDNEINVSDFSSHFAWETILNGWTLKAQDVVFKTQNSMQKESQFNVQYRSDNADNYSFDVTANGLSLKAITSIFQSVNVTDDSVLPILKEVKPTGLLNHASVSIQRRDTQLSWATCGELQGLTSEAYEAFPSINNFSGTGCATQDKGWLQLDVDNGSIHFTPLFREPITVDQLNGQLTWHKDAYGWSIKSDHITMNSPHIATQTRVNVTLPDGDEKPSIDLQTNFGAADSRYTALYLPVGIMGKQVVNWLDAAFIEGGVQGGGLLLSGPLSSFPYRQNEGVFQVLFSAQNLRLHYADNWPDALGVSADIEFKNEGMKIDGHEGLIAGNEIDHVLVNIADFKTDKYLHLSGKVKNDIQGLYTFFKQSPLNEQMSGLLDYSTVSGSSVLDLNLDIPLRKNLKTKVKAKAQLKDNRLTVPDVGLVINAIEGEIEYDDQGIRGDSITGHFLDEKLSLAIKTEKDSTVIEGNGPLTISRLAKQYPSDFWRHIKGAGLAKVKVELPHKGLATGRLSTITLSSSLKGVGVDLPAPVGKQKNQVKPFKAIVQLGQSSLPIKAWYGDSLKTYIRLTNSQDKKLALEKADIHFGKDESKLPVKQGVQLSGEIEVLNITQWQQALGVDTSRISEPPMINQFNLNVRTLEWLDRIFDNVLVSGTHQHSTWSGEVNSPTVIGRYKVPDKFVDGSTISLELDTLKLPSNEGQVYSGKIPPMSPTDIPNLDLSSKEFFIGRSKLGTLTLQLRQKDNGVVIETLSLKSDRDDFKAGGAWEVLDGQSITGLKGTLNSQSLGSLLADMHITKKLKDAPVEFYFDLNWLGEPQDFSKDTLSGYAEIKSGQGRLLDVEPGIGRIFGLLSLNTLQRRLQLDFSDLVQKGLSFDKIKGRFNLLKGEASTKRFYLESPSARLDFQGDVSLVNEQLDQLITVTPKTTESLPLAGAIAGGPLVGAAVFIAQKIAGKTVNKLAGYQYRVTGPWRDPTIEQISQPGGKIFGMMDNVLTPVFDATLGQLPLSGQKANEP